MKAAKIIIIVAIIALILPFAASARDWYGEISGFLGEQDPDEPGSFGAVVNETLLVEALHDMGNITDEEYNNLTDQIQDFMDEWLKNRINDLDPKNKSLKPYVDLQWIIELEDWWGMEYWDEEQKASATAGVHAKASDWLKERVDELDPNDPNFKPFSDLILIQEVEEIDRKFSEEAKAYKYEHMQEKMDQWLKNRADEITTMGDLKEMKDFQQIEDFWKIFGEDAKKYKEEQLRKKFATMAHNELKKSEADIDYITEAANYFCPEVPQLICNELNNGSLDLAKKIIATEKESIMDRIRGAIRRSLIIRNKIAPEQSIPNVTKEWNQPAGVYRDLTVAGSNSLAFRSKFRVLGSNIDIELPMQGNVWQIKNASEEISERRLQFRNEWYGEDFGNKPNINIEELSDTEIDRGFRFRVDWDVPVTEPEKIEDDADCRCGDDTSGKTANGLCKCYSGDEIPSNQAGHTRCLCDEESVLPTWTGNKYVCVCPEAESETDEDYTPCNLDFDIDDPFWMVEWDEGDSDVDYNDVEDCFDDCEWSYPPEDDIDDQQDCVEDCMIDAGLDPSDPPELFCLNDCGIMAPPPDDDMQDCVEDCLYDICGTP